MFLVRVKVSSLNIKRDHVFLVLTEKRKFEKGRKPTEKIIGFFRVGK